MRNVVKYLTRLPQRKDVLSIFAGLRPLAAPAEGSGKTKEISRRHKLIVSASGLITITGGKWTTYRRMAQDTIDTAIASARLQRQPCVSQNLPVHGNKKTDDYSDSLHVYGSDREALLMLADENEEWRQKLHPGMDHVRAQVIWAVMYEMARTVEDVLARRLNVLFVDAKIAIEMAPAVAALMAAVLNRDKAWQNSQVEDFRRLAKGYLLND